MPSGRSVATEAVPSKEVARQRLKIVLIHDRAEASRGFLEKIKEELVAVVARYGEVDSAKVEVRMARSDSESAILARIPVRNLRRAP